MDVRFNLIKRAEGENKNRFGIVSARDQVENPEFKIPDMKPGQFSIGIHPIPVKVEDEAKDAGSEAENEEVEDADDEDTDEEDEDTNEEEEDEDTDEEDTDDEDEGIREDAELVGGGEEDDGIKRNSERCRDLEAQLAKKLERDKWAISLKLKINSEELTTDRYDSFEELDGWWVNTVDIQILVEGEVLGKLHSLMLYRLEKGHARLKMKIQGTLEAIGEDTDVDEEDIDEHRSQYTSVFQADLVPLDGSFNHSMYTASNIKVKNRFGHSQDTMYIAPNINDGWCLSSLRLIVEGTLSDFDNYQALTNIEIYGQNKEMLETAEQDGDLKIIAEEGTISIPCHSSVLRVRSDFVKAMVSGRFGKDAKERTLEMKERSKDEITALLKWFYYRGTEKPLRTPSVAIAMYEMGDYLLVAEVKETMEGILLTRPAQWFSVESGLELYALGEKYGKGEFQRKAIDVLEIRTDEELKAVEYFGQLYPSSELEKDFLTSRKKFF